MEPTVGLFSDHNRGLFSEPVYSVGAQVVVDSGNSTFSGLQMALSNFSINGIKVSASWVRSRFASAQDYLMVQTVDPFNAVVDQQIFRVSANSGQNSAVVDVPNMLNFDGQWQIHVIIDDDETINAMDSYRPVTVSGIGSVGGDVTREEFNAVVQAIANLQDHETEQDFRLDLLTGNLIGVEDNIGILEGNIGILEQNIAKFAGTAKRVDQFTLNELLQLGRWTDEHVETPFVVSALDEISTTDDLSDATLQAALTRPLLEAAPYTSGGGTGNSILDAIFAFFQGFGIGSTAALIIIGLIAYLVFSSKGSQIIRI